MSLARTVDPLEALAVFTTELNPKKPRNHSLSEATFGFLASPVPIPPARSVSSGQPDKTESKRYALHNGYAVSGEELADTEYPFLGVLTMDGQVYGADGQPLPERNPNQDAGNGIWRVETGAPLPAQTDRVIPVDKAVIVSGAQLKLLATAPTGSGVRQDGEIHANAGRQLEFPAGTRLDARLQATLLAHAVPSVAVRPQFSVGFGTVGDELVDVAASAGELSPMQRLDINGYWLHEAITALNLRPVALGILPDCPQRLGDVIHSASRRKLDAVVLTGGIGDGFSDRVLETLRRLNARIPCGEVALNGGMRLVLAKTQGVDVICLPGAPLRAAALFDLFVRPALLAAFGASPTYWDWSKDSRLPFSIDPPRPMQYVPNGWSLYLARLHESDDRPDLIPWNALIPEQPSVPGALGWLLVGPEDGSRPRVFYAPSE